MIHHISAEQHYILEMYAIVLVISCSNKILQLNIIMNENL
jgi:hypothetical protein